MPRGQEEVSHARSPNTSFRQDARRQLSTCSSVTRRPAAISCAREHQIVNGHSYPLIRCRQSCGHIRASKTDGRYSVDDTCRARPTPGYELPALHDSWPPCHDAQAMRARDAGWGAGLSQRARQRRRPVCALDRVCLPELRAVATPPRKPILSPRLVKREGRIGSDVSRANVAHVFTASGGRSRVDRRSRHDVRIALPLYPRT
jgi:hypothetical protein